MQWHRCHVSLEMLSPWIIKAFSTSLAMYHKTKYQSRVVTFLENVMHVRWPFAGAESLAATVIAWHYLYQIMQITSSNNLILNLWWVCHRNFTTISSNYWFYILLNQWIMFSTFRKKIALIPLFLKWIYSLFLLPPLGMAPLPPPPCHHVANLLLITMINNSFPEPNPRRRESCRNSDTRKWGIFFFLKPGAFRIKFWNHP